MSMLGNLPISRKLAVSFGIVCALCVLQGSLAIFGIVKLNTAINEINSNQLPSVQLVGAIRTSVSQMRRIDLALLLCETPECKQRSTTNGERASKEFDIDMEKYAPLATTPGEPELYRTMREKIEAYRVVSAQAHQMQATGDLEGARKLQVTPAAAGLNNDAQKAADEDVQLNAKEAQEAGESTSRLGHTVLVSIVVFGFGTLIVATFTGVALTRSIAPPLKAATAALERVAAKDLTISVEAHGTDEIGRMGTALNTSVASMRDVLRIVAQGAENLSAAAAEMSSRSMEAHGNATSQADKTGQIAAAAVEMTATIREISQNAESAAVSSRVSAETATQGGQVMQETALTMERISAATATVGEKMDSLSRRSVEIGKVVSAIQDISEQTNLLALNAAIEAARAGEHGRGFAVVAGEVRRLAERTKGATEEIAGTIRSIQDETRQTVEVMSSSREAVETGIGETARARTSLTAIIEASKQVEGQIHLIATAATEQSAASGEISESVSHISQLAMQNSHAAEESTEACKSLSVLANELDGVIRQFRIDDDRQSGGRPGLSTANATRRPYRTA